MPGVYSKKLKIWKTEKNDMTKLRFSTLVLAVVLTCWASRALADDTARMNQFIDDLMGKMTLQEISREGLQGLAGTIVTMAEAEGLQAHANAVKIRLQDE